MALPISIPLVQNRELGSSTRDKINEVIDILNNLEDYAPDGPPGPAGPEGPPGPDVRVIINVIGFSESTADLPASANLGDAWLITGSGVASDAETEVEVYIFSDGQWRLAFLFTAPFSEFVENTIYVTKGGNDGNEGRSLSDSFLTIGRAIQEATAISEDNVAIYVYPGIYVEDGNLAIPPNCAVISAAGQYVTEVHASQECRENYRNMFLLDSGSSVDGFTFRNQEIDNFNNPTGGFALAWVPGARILRSPYAKNLAQVSNYIPRSVSAPLEADPPGFEFDDPNYTENSDFEHPNPLVGNGGGVALADRAILDPTSIFPSMLLFAATPRSNNGIGYCAKNGAFINGISSISIFQQCSFFALNGGQVTLNNSGTQFGDVSMRATGFTWIIRPVDKSGEGNLIEEASLKTILDVNTPTLVDDTWNASVSNNPDLADEETEAFFRRDLAQLIEAIGFDYEGGTQKVTQSFTLGKFAVGLNSDPNGLIEYSFEEDLLSDLLFAYGFLEGQIATLIVNSGFNFNDQQAYNRMLEDLFDILTETLQNRAGLQIPFGSLIESLGHQFNNAGSGVNKNALPLNLSRPGSNNPVEFSIIQQDRGRVRFSGGDELNNQYFARGTKINGITGKLEGRPFDSAVRQIARRLSNARGII